MVVLTDEQLAALRDVRAVWPDADLFLIGAQALAAHIDMSHRHTEDLDLAVAVSLAEFPAELPHRSGWEQHPKRTHHFISPCGESVDIVPAGPDLRSSGTLEWPDGHTMSLVGFDLAFAHADAMRWDDVELLLPSAPTLALKMRAWLDRPVEREKDLRDLAQLFQQHVGEDDARRWEDEVPEDLDFEVVSAFLLGRDLAAICDALHRPHLTLFFERLRPAKLAAATTAWVSDPWVRAHRTLLALRRGLAF